jgi:NADH-quinone oxidoreductase subunit G
MVSAPGHREDRELVTVEIDGRQFRVQAGRNMLDVALSLGFNLPFFCWHPVMGSIGACRQCAVRLFWTDREGHEKSEIAMACMTEAQEGTRISIDDEEAVRFRARMIELMMMSHPHDCPVCDEGGECHLQDMTVMTGHNYRRYRGHKRTFENQDLGPFVAHEMNRCITCYRCTRLYNDFAGGHDFGSFGLRNQIFFGRGSDGTLESEFSGNLVEVCPTGVFTDKTLARHYTRKWDLQTAPSVCPHCGLGCNTQPGERYGSLRRVLSRYHSEINRMFLCDRGRYGYEYVNAAARVREPLIAASAGQQPVTAARALGHAGWPLREGRVIGIGSPRASLEANFALRTLVGPERFYLGMSDEEYDLVGLALDIARSGRVRLGALADVQAADAAFVFGEDVTNVAPMLDLTLRTWLRLRPTPAEERVHITRWNDAAIGRFKRREPSSLWIAATHAAKLDELANQYVHAAPTDLVRLVGALVHAVDPTAPPVPGMTASERDRVQGWAAALSASREPLIATGTAGGSEELLRAAARLASSIPGARFILTVPEPNSMGLRMIDGGRLSQAFAAVTRGDADTVVVLDNDLYRRAPALVVDDFFAHRPHIIALSALADRTSRQAEVVLPSATVAEATGTFVNHEGRAQRFFSVMAPQGSVRDPWRWLNELAAQRDWSAQPAWPDLDHVMAALEAELPQFRGVVEAAPPATWRRHELKVARQSARWSGRTAADADVSVHEPEPAGDPDSALAYSLEGLRPDEAPAALLARNWWPGWNSASGLHKLQEEVNGPLRHGPVGKRLLDSGATGSGTSPFDTTRPAPAAFRPRPNDWLLVPVHHIFGSDDLSMHTPGVAQRAPKPYVGLNADDATKLGLMPGDELSLWLPWLDFRAAWRLMPSLPTGVAGLPVGLPGMPFIALPARGRLSRFAPGESQTPAGTSTSEPPLTGESS